MIWMRPVTEYSELTSPKQRTPKYHLIGEWAHPERWVALCDMRARQYDHFQPGEQADDPDDKCGRCSVIKR